MFSPSGATFTALAIALLAASTAHALTPPPRVLFVQPEDTQAQQFNPTVQEVLHAIYNGKAPDDVVMRGYWEGWGELAVGYITELYAQNDNEHARQVLLQLLGYAPFPAAHDWLLEELRRLRGECAGGDVPTNSCRLLSDAARAGGQMDAPEIQRELLDMATADLRFLRTAAASGLLSGTAEDNKGVAASIVKDFVTDNPRGHDAAVDAIRYLTPVAIDRSESIIAAILQQLNAEDAGSIASIYMYKQTPAATRIVEGVLQRLADSLDRRERERAVSILSRREAPGDLDRMEAIAASFSGEKPQRIVYDIERVRGKHRAQEPMALILEREKNR